MHDDKINELVELVERNDFYLRENGKVVKVKNKSQIDAEKVRQFMCLARDVFALYNNESKVDKKLIPLLLNFRTPQPSK